MKTSRILQKWREMNQSQVQKHRKDQDVTQFIQNMQRTRILSSLLNQWNSSAVSQMIANKFIEQKSHLTLRRFYNCWMNFHQLMHTKKKIDRKLWNLYKEIKTKHLFWAWKRTTFGAKYWINNISTKSEISHSDRSTSDLCFNSKQQELFFKEKNIYQYLQQQQQQKGRHNKSQRGIGVNNRYLNSETKNQISSDFKKREGSRPAKIQRGREQINSQHRTPSPNLYSNQIRYRKHSPDMQSNTVYYLSGKK